MSGCFYFLSWNKKGKWKTVAEYVLGPTVFTPLWRESRYAVDLLHCKQFCVMQNNVCVCGCITVCLHKPAV